MTESRCPHCKVSLDGGPIPEEYHKNYSPPYRWRRDLAIYDLNLDRRVGWRCPDCGGEWKSRKETERE